MSYVSIYYIISSVFCVEAPLVDIVSSYRIENSCSRFSIVATNNNLMLYKL